MLQSEHRPLVVCLLACEVTQPLDYLLGLVTPIDIQLFYTRIKAVLLLLFFFSIS